MDFPIAEFMDEDSCYTKLVAILHPGGLICLGCGIGDRLKVHRRHRAPVIDYRCEARGRVFNAFTGTAFHKTHRRPSEMPPSSIATARNCSPDLKTRRPRQCTRANMTCPFPGARHSWRWIKQRYAEAKEQARNA